LVIAVSATTTLITPAESYATSHATSHPTNPTRVARATTPKEIIICTGLDQSKEYKLVLKAKSQSNVENKAIAYWASVDQPDGIGYDGIIFGFKSDVQLNLRPRRHGNVQLSGTIFMDQTEQDLTYENSDNKMMNLKLNCEFR